MLMSLSRTAEATTKMYPCPGLDAPAVPGTSRLVEVMQLAAARLMRTQLRPGESSVAVSTDLRHAALSRARGDTLRASASCQAIEGRLHRFEVNVFDESGLVASCEHVRAVVMDRRLEGRARGRMDAQDINA
jgi:fluoroacetyl-CoA thioesterase